MTTVNIVPSTSDEGKFVSLVEHIPLSSYISYQHGRIDSTVVGLAGSHARRVSFAAGFASTSAGDANYKGGRTQSSGGIVTDTKTIFAISNHVRIAVPDKVHYERHPTASQAEEATIDRELMVVSATSTCSAIVTISKVGGSSATLAARLYQEPEGGAANHTASSNPEAIVQRGKYIGTALVTMVTIDKATRKSAPIDDDKRKGLISGLNENLIEQWESEDRTAFDHFERLTMTPDEEDGSRNKISTHALNASRIDVNIPLLMKAATNGKVKMEGAKEETLPAKVVLLDADKCTLRPSDFDFNGHLNMNMYVSFCVDALRASIRRAQEHRLKGEFASIDHVNGDAGLLAAPLGSALINNINFYSDATAGYHSIADTPFRTLVGDIAAHQHMARVAKDSENHEHRDQNAMHRVPTVEELVLSRKIEYKQEITDMNCTVETSIIGVFPLDKVVPNNHGKNDWRHSSTTPWVLKFLVRSVPADGDQKKAFVAAMCEMVLAPPPTAY